MSNKQVYSVNTLEMLKIEIDKLKEKRKTILSLEQILLQPKKDILALIKSGCTAKELAKTFQAAQINIGVAKIKQLYFAKKTNSNKQKVREHDAVLPQNNQD